MATEVLDGRCQTGLQLDLRPPAAHAVKEIEVAVVVPDVDALVIGRKRHELPREFAVPLEDLHELEQRVMTLGTEVEGASVKARIEGRGHEGLDDVVDVVAVAQLPAIAKDPNRFAADRLAQENAHEARLVARTMLPGTVGIREPQRNRLHAVDLRVKRVV